MKGEIMPATIREVKNNNEEIRIPMKYIQRIDKIINIGGSVYSSRSEFIRSAVEIKLAELKRSGFK